MKRSKLYNTLIRSCRSEITRIERQMEKNRKAAQRAIGRYKKELDEAYELLSLKRDYWKAQMTQAYRIRDRARAGEKYWGQCHRQPNAGRLPTPLGGGMFKRVKTYEVWYDITTFYDEVLEDRKSQELSKKEAKDVVKRWKDRDGYSNIRLVEVRRRVPWRLNR